jgi:hypothetical protein
MKVYLSLIRSWADAAKTAGARSRNVSKDRPCSKAVAWAENDKGEIAFMVKFLEMFLGRDCPRPGNHGARSGQGSKTAAGGECVLAFVLDGEHSVIR